MAPDAELRLLGPIELVVDGTLVPLGGPRQRTILARLALARGASVPKGVLIDDVWREAAPANAAKSLTTQLTRLRRALHPHGGQLEHASAGYNLRLPDRLLDLDAFEQDVAEARALTAGGLTGRAITTLRTGLARWRGEPLADAVDVPFVRAAAEALHGQRRAAEDELVALHLRIRDLGPAIGLLERMVDDTPYDEARWALLVQALGAAGQRRAAIDAFQRARALLRDDLGIEPGEQLRLAELGVLQSTTEAAPPVDRLRHWTEPPLVGRELELEVLDAALARAADGLRVVLLHGEPGIGKSRLLSEFRARATRRGATVLAGGCDAGSVVPLRAVLTALRPVLSGHEALDLSTDPVLLELVGLLDPARTELPPGGFDLTRYRLLRAITNTVERLVRRAPLVLAVDDLQWADPFTLSVLHHLVTEMADGRLLLLATARPTPDGIANLEQLAGAVRHGVAVDRVGLGVLSPEDGRALLTAIPGLALAADDVAALLAASGGNPLFLTQLALHRRGRDAAGSLPSSVESVCRERLNQLPTDSAEVLRAAAVYGPRFDGRSVAAMLDRPLRAVDRALDAAEWAGLVVPDGTPAGIRFVHGVVREVLLDSLSASERRFLHHRAAAVTRTGHDTAIVAAQHLAAAQPLSRPSELYAATMTAGELAARQGALEAAAELFRLAEGTAPDDAGAAAAAIQSGLVARAAGRDDVARRDLARGERLGRNLERWDLVADALLADAELGIAVSIPDALARAEVVADVLERLPDYELDRRVRLLCWTAHLLVNVDAERTEAAIDAADRLAAALDRGELRREVAYARLRQRESAAADPSACEAAAMALADEAVAAGDELTVIHAYLVCQAARLRGGRFRRVLEDNPRFLADVRGVRRPILELGLEAAKVAAMFATEPLDVVDAQSEALSEWAFAAGVPAATLARAIQVLLIRREQGRMAELEPLIRLYASAGPGRTVDPWLAGCHLEAGEAAAAQQILDGLLEHGPGALNRDWMHEALVATTIDVAYDLGSTDPRLEQLGRDLAPVIDQVVVLASSLGILGHVRRYVGRVAFLLGDLDAAVELCAEARTRELEAGSDLWAGWAAHDEAAARLARGRTDDRTDADRLLTDAVQRAARVGSERLRRAVVWTAAGRRPG